MRKIDLKKHRKETEKDMQFAPVRRVALDEAMGNFFFSPFSGMGILKPFNMPAIDICEEGDKVRVNAELPGVKKGDINLHIENGVLTLTGETKRERKVKRKDYCCSERTFGKIQRSVCLPEGVKEDSAKASYKDGILTVEFQKTKELVHRGRDLKVE